MIYKHQILMIFSKDCQSKLANYMNSILLSLKPKIIMVTDVVIDFETLNWEWLLI